MSHYPLVTSKINQERALRVAVKRIEGFTKQFGEEHRDLALHAAFPLALTPDLLYQIWANFVPEAPWTAVAHVLLSRLCREVGYEMYEMEISDRNLLLRELKKEFGQQRLDELAEFLLDYVAQRLTGDDSDIRDLREAQEWTALAYTKPDELARELAEALSERVKGKDMGEVLRLASLVENFAEPLLEAGFEPLLVYADGMASFVRGSREDATAQFRKLPRRRNQVEIAGVSLNIPLEEQTEVTKETNRISDSYIERSPIEQQCYDEILQPGALIRIKAPHQFGKTLLMNRILSYAAEQGYQTVALSLQQADKSIFTNLEKFLQWFCVSVSRQLQISNRLQEYWDDLFGSKISCSMYFENYLLAQSNSPLVLGLDELDRLFGYPEITSEFLGLLRSWHEQARDGRIWTKFRLIVVHTTEVYIPIDVNTSPFNIGLPIELPEFSPKQVQNLAQKHGLDWTNIQIDQLMALVGGHPYLVEQALNRIKYRDITLEQLLEAASREGGIYSDHLRQHLLRLEQYPELMSAFSKVVTTNQPTKLKTILAFKLNSMGLVRVEDAYVTPRCNLYARYFRNYLSSSAQVKEVIENYYKVGGALPPGVSSYVVRQADEDLYKWLKAGEFCYVLGSWYLGKTSLLRRTMQRLQAEGIVCAPTDLSNIRPRGTISPEQWYYSIIYRLHNELELDKKFDLRTWWSNQSLLLPVQRLSKFIEKVVLTEISQNIVIVIDSIDYIARLNSSTDDFFSFIRDCYNQRAEKPEYQRLTFAVLGIATPSELIRDAARSPFNIGRAIELHGFQLQEALPLAKGLERTVENPQAVLREILQWTNGQPFLTQKLCQLVYDTESYISAGREAERVEQLVQTQVIEDWESHDELWHLRAIRNRLLWDRQRTSQMLLLYKQILQGGEVLADNSPEQMELRLSGLVIKQDGKLRVFNPIYEAIFNLAWVERELGR